MTQVRMMNPFKQSHFLVALGAILLLALTSTLFAEKVSAHGYLEAPASRAYKCKLGENKGCGAVVYEPQSIEVAGQYPAGGPADGNLASGGIYKELDAQTADRWSKVTMNGGQNTFKWFLTANHATKNWQYYITKKGWDPNKPLARADFEPLCYFDDKGARPAKDISHTCDLPTDRSGYHVILAVWQIADTPNAFYQVVDVNLVNDGSGIQLPTTPGSLTSVSQATYGLNLSWTASNATNGIKEYEVYRDGVLVGKTVETKYADSGLTPNTAYTYTVIAVDNLGNKSAASAPYTAKTTTDGNGGVTAPAWNASSVYLKGAKVSYNGLVYEARWWTQNETPGKAEVWKLVN